MNIWAGVEFESSSRRTPQFAAFCRAYRAHIKATMGGRGYVIVKWTNGHFCCSAFIRNKATGAMAYISCSDVRFFPGDWLRHILYRSAQSDMDYTGGANHYSTLANLPRALHKILGD